MSLDVKKKKLELSRVRMAREELEFKIDERKEDIKRLQEHVQAQMKKEDELAEEISKLSQQQ